MKKLKMLLIVLISFLQHPFGQGTALNDATGLRCYYNHEDTPVKSMNKYKDSLYKDDWGGFAKIELGLSPTHPRGFTGLSLGCAYQNVELQLSALPGFGGGSNKIHVFDALLGYRQPINMFYTVTPMIGYWTYWNEVQPIDFSNGNHFVYGAKVSRKVENNIWITVSWTDHRGQKQWNAMKIGTIGAQYNF